MNSIIPYVKNLHEPMYHQIIDHPKIVVISVLALSLGLGLGVSAMVSTAALITKLTLIIIIPSAAAIASYFAIDLCEEFEFAASQLRTPTMSEWEKEEIMASPNRVPVTERDDFVVQLRRLVTPEWIGMDVKKLIDTLKTIPANKRENYVTQLNLLITPAIDKSYKFILIKELSDTPENERDGIIAQIIQLTTQQVSVVGRSMILACINTIPVNIKLSRLNRAFLQLQDDLQQFPNLNVFNRVRVLLQTPLNENFPPVLGGMAAAAAAGNIAINVHDGERDRNTIAALALLRTAQGAIEQDRIDQAVNQFINYLQTVEGIEDGTRQLAFKALNGAPNPNDFGPLLGDPQCCSYHISGEEAIARHWIFANTYQDPAPVAEFSEQERNNAKLGMITALSTSCDPGSTLRICNEGKVQRLVVSVLQGRLLGVDVDKIPALVPVRAAVEMFFNDVRNREIGTREELLRAANTFCEQNPGVERLGFLAEMQTYADEQGMA